MRLKRGSFWGKPKTWILSMMVLAVVVVFVLVVRSLNSPAQGVVTTPRSRNSTAKVTPVNTTYSDKYLSFKYPTKYTINPAPKSPGYLDSINLITSQRRDQFAAISLLKEGLADDSGVSYRKGHPELYKQIASSASTEVFKKIDETEYTGFIEHNDQVLAISLTSVAPTDLSGDYQQIANSLRWKQ